MFDKVRQYIDQNNILRQGDKVLVAVSGGVDSIALLDVLLRLRDNFKLGLHVAHLNHMFRGQQSMEDAFFVDNICRSLALPVVYASADVPEAASQGGSAQEAARQVRYEYLRRLARIYRCNKIALGHHMDDQAETVLHNLLRGSGMVGLAGMLPAHGKIIRPLLAVEKGEIEEYCRRRKLNWREDPSNKKCIYRRNKIRNRLIPELQAEYNSQLVPILSQTADILQGENEFLGIEAKRCLQEICRWHNEEAVIELAGLKKLHPAMCRRLLRLVAQRVNGQTLAFNHVEMIAEFVNQHQTGKKLELPRRLVVQKDYHHLIMRLGSRPGDSAGNHFCVELPVPGKILLQRQKMVIVAEISDRTSFVKADDFHVVLDQNKLKMPLVVRNRRPGDRFQPLGAQGGQKLKEFFINRKVPVGKRDKIPLVVDDKDEIIWVVGYTVNHMARVTETSKELIEFRAWYAEKQVD